MSDILYFTILEKLIIVFLMATGFLFLVLVERDDPNINFKKIKRLMKMWGFYFTTKLQNRLKLKKIKEN